MDILEELTRRGVIRAAGMYVAIAWGGTEILVFLIDALQLVDINPKSIAVLPFVKMSGDEDNTYFSHGMSEELLNVLARTPSLKVSSRTSSITRTYMKFLAATMESDLEPKTKCRGWQRMPES